MVETLLSGSCCLGLLSTVYMTGIVWFAQLVHYPLLDRTQGSSFTAFTRAYQRRTLWAVTPALVGEITSCIGLIWVWLSIQSAMGFVLLMDIWSLT